MKGPSLPVQRRTRLVEDHRRPHELDMAASTRARGNRLRIYDVMIKPRAACASAISSILAAEKALRRSADPRAISGCLGRDL